MNIEKILTRIRNAGLTCRDRWSEAGPVVQVRIPKQNRAISGLAPIDNESDDRFADYLIAEARGLVEG